MKDIFNTGKNFSMNVLVMKFMLLFTLDLLQKLKFTIHSLN